MLKHLKPILRNLRSYSQVSTPLTEGNLYNGMYTITMNHQKTRNSLSIPMMQELIDRIESNENDAKVRIIVLAAAPGAVFSAGHNLKELSLDNGVEHQKRVFSLASRLMCKLIDSPVPIIARIDGLAAAAGCQLIAQCDLAFCTEKSAFSTPGADFGIFCSTPGVALARSIPKSVSLKMLLTGKPISGLEAEKYGLITKCLPDTQTLDEEIAKTCDAIKSKSRAILELGKKFYYKQVNVDVKSAYKIGAQQMVDNLQMPDGQEGVTSFMEKRKPKWNH